MPLDRKKLEAAIAAQDAKTPFSGVLYLREGDEVLIGQGFGFANHAEKLPNTLQTRLGTASGAKTFTSVAICQLVERGLLTFDTRLAACLDLPFPKAVRGCFGAVGPVKAGDREKQEIAGGLPEMAGKNL